jgi:hypothetical protein
VSSTNLANTDGDDLGDVCDPDAALQRRVLFDGFGTLAGHWTQTAAWAATGDVAETVDGPHPRGFRLTHVGVLIDGATPWTVEVAFDVPASPADNDSIGANLVDAQGNVQWGCTVLYQSSTWNVTNGVGQPIVLPTGRTKMVLSSKRAMSTDHLCTLPGNPEKVNQAFLESYPMGVELFANRVARFSYIEVIE